MNGSDNFNVQNYLNNLVKYQNDGSDVHLKAVLFSTINIIDQIEKLWIGNFINDEKYF